MEKKKGLKTIQEMELEEAEEHLEWEKKELEHQIESYYADKENNKTQTQELFKCDNCETLYSNKITSNKITLVRDSYYKNEDTILCEECYDLNDDVYKNRKWIKQD